MFQQLNQEDGITIILVTHDPLVAKHARRVIRICDGLILGDSESSCEQTGEQTARVGDLSETAPGGA
jgi:ABC-type lipoprotein export system ATPase subunit